MGCVPQVLFLTMNTDWTGRSGAELRRADGGGGGAAEAPAEASRRGVHEKARRAPLSHSGAPPPEGGSESRAARRGRACARTHTLSTVSLCSSPLLPFSFASALWPVRCWQRRARGRFAEAESAAFLPSVRRLPQIIYELSVGAERLEVRG